MNIYDNDRLSLPEQVENNRQNIEILFGSIEDNEMVLSHEILLKNRWEQVDNVWQQFVAIPRMTDYTLTLTTCVSSSDTAVDAFRNLISADSTESGVYYIIKNKPTVDIEIDVWYNVVIDD